MNAVDAEESPGADSGSHLLQLGALRHMTLLVAALEQVKHSNKSPLLLVAHVLTCSIGSFVGEFS